MIVLRNKEFSVFGKFKAGMKGAINKGAKGALVGSILVPGNLLALMLGKGKTALKITTAGAGVGAVIGGVIGYKSGVEDYNYKEKLKTPEGRKELIEFYSKKLVNLIKSSNEFYVPNTWEGRYKQAEEKGNIPEMPEEFYKYMKSINKFTSKFRDLWYKDILNNPQKYINEKDPRASFELENKENINLKTFNSLVLVPASPDDFYWLVEFLSSAFFACLNNGNLEDDDYGCSIDCYFDQETNEVIGFGDSCLDLKKALIENAENFIKPYLLNQDQNRVYNEYIKLVQTL